MHPVRFNIHDPVALLQKKNVGRNLCPGIRFKCSIGKSYSTHKVCPLRKILTDFLTLLIHRSLTCNKRHNAAGADLIKRLGKEIIVDQKVIFIIRSVIYLILSERHISNCRIEKVIGKVCFFIAPDLDMGFRIKLLCDPPAESVQFHAI